ncbi:MAG TPA: GDP-mannose 4,6-dehydratase [Vicinamibacteria bacterium]
MKVLITGVGGFVGAHLVEHIRREHPQAEIFGLTRPHGSAGTALQAGLRLLEADLNDPASLEPVLDVVAPDRIFHLAGQSSVHVSWTDPGGTLRTNILGLVHLVDALRRRRLKPALLVVGSAEEYGSVLPEDLPLREDAPLLPASPYATSKTAQGLLAAEYARGLGLPLVRTRTFHHTGPGRGEAFAESSFARQIAEIEAGLREKVLLVGNLEAVRDYTDVRDVVRAYWALADRASEIAGGVVNVCSGRGLKIHDLLDILLARAKVQVEIRVDKERLRPSDVPAQVGDPARLKALTGWEPKIPLEQSLAELLDDWRARVGPAVPRPVTP